MATTLEIEDQIREIAMQTCRDAIQTNSPTGLPRELNEHDKRIVERGIIRIMMVVVNNTNLK